MTDDDGRLTWEDFEKTIEMLEVRRGTPVSKEFIIPISPKEYEARSTGHLSKTFPLQNETATGIPIKYVIGPYLEDGEWRLLDD